MKRANKLILVDADGVLLDWFYSFSSWMNAKGHPLVKPDNYDLSIAFDLDKPTVKQLTRHFNESAWMEFLSPFRDAAHYVPRLHKEHGYVFHCITSLSNDLYAANLRQRNLSNLFGPTVFEKLICLDTGEDKEEALCRYANSGCIWVEDKPENAEVGYALGLSSILMSHGHNKNFLHHNIPVVNNWKEIYHMIT